MLTTPILFPPKECITGYYGLKHLPIPNQQKNAKRAARAIISKLKRLKNAPTSSVDDNTEDDEYIFFV